MSAQFSAPRQSLMYIFVSSCSLPRIWCVELFVPCCVVTSLGRGGITVKLSLCVWSCLRVERWVSTIVGRPFLAFHWPVNCQQWPNQPLTAHHYDTLLYLCLLCHCVCLLSTVKPYSTAALSQGCLLPARVLLRISRHSAVFGTVVIWVSAGLTPMSFER